MKREPFVIKEIGNSCYSEQISLFVNIIKDMDGWDFIDVMKILERQLQNATNSFNDDQVVYNAESKISKRIKETDGFNPVFVRVDYVQHFSTDSTWNEDKPFITVVQVGTLDEIYKEEYTEHHWELYDNGHLITKRETSKFYMFACTEDCGLYEIKICENF